MTSSPLRSLLFIPATRLGWLPKARACQPDAIVLDLEDAVPLDAKDEARHALRTGLPDCDCPLFVRVNPVSSPWFLDDLELGSAPGVDGLVLPKAENTSAVDRVRAATETLFLGLETGRGVLRAVDLCCAGVAAVYFGAEDYITDLGGRRTSHGAEVLYARSQIALAAAVAGVTAIDQAVLDIHNDDGFQADAEAGANFGYHGKICIHPQQVALANAAFTPSESEVSWARQVLAARPSGVTVIDGRMIDQVHVRNAESIMRRTRT